MLLEAVEAKGASVCTWQELEQQTDDDPLRALAAAALAEAPTVRTAAILLDRTFAAHKDRIITFAMSPDGKRFLTVGADNTVKAWDTATGAELRAWAFREPVLAQKHFVRSIAFTPDGKQAVTANFDGTLYLLDMP